MEAKGPASLFSGSLALRWQDDDRNASAAAAGVPLAGTLGARSGGRIALHRPAARFLPGTALRWFVGIRMGRRSVLATLAAPIDDRHGLAGEPFDGTQQTVFPRLA